MLLCGARCSLTDWELAEGSTRECGLAQAATRGCVARCKLKIAASPTQPSRLPAQVPPTCKYSGGILRLEDKFLVIMSTPPENNRQLFSGGVLIITITAQKHEPPSLRTFELQVNRRRDLQLSVAIIITSAPAASSKVETLSVPDSELLGGLSAARHT